MSFSKVAIITPVKNEIKFLPKLLENVLNQSLKPAFWLIIDDNSDDGSSELILDYASKYGFIYTFKNDSSKRDMLVHYSTLIEKGINYLKYKEIDYDFFGILDADILLSKGYYQRIVEKFNKKSILGITSGSILVPGVSGFVREGIKNRSDSPRGGNRVFRKECLNQIKFRSEISSNGLSLARARMHGWHTSFSPEIMSVQRRKTSTVGGASINYKMIARRLHYVDTPFLQVLARFIRYTYTVNLFSAIMMIFYFIYFHIIETPQCDNKKLIKYMRVDNYNIFKKEVFNRIFNRS